MKTNEVLTAMEELINEGEQITTENYKGQNKKAFQDFAKANGFRVDTVVKTWEENEEYLTQLYREKTTPIVAFHIGRGGQIQQRRSLHVHRRAKPARPNRKTRHDMPFRKRQGQKRKIHKTSLR